MLLLGTLSLAVVSCGDSTGPANGGCDGTVDVTITSGTSPTFSWNPACTVGLLWIQDLTETDPTKQLVWSIQAEQNLIKPPVQYGVTPANALQTQAPLSLIGQGGDTPAHLYSFNISVYASDGTLNAFALQNFTP
jgi:hypothetical protein